MSWGGPGPGAPLLPALATVLATALATLSATLLATPLTVLSATLARLLAAALVFLSRGFGGNVVGSCCDVPPQGDAHISVSAAAWKTSPTASPAAKREAVSAGCPGRPEAAAAER